VIVLPTGAGKSLVIAELCRKAIEARGRVLVLAHRKELLEQNAEKVRNLLGGGVGLYSAGLKRWQSDDAVVLAGIQTAYKRADVFGPRHLVLIDEVHLVPGDGEGMYRTFLDKLREYNPQLRGIGLTATAYRTGEGSICGPNKLFQRIAYEAKVQPLIAEGYLSPLVSAPAVAAVDVSKVKIVRGDFAAGEMESLFDDSVKVKAAVRETVEKTAGRQSVLVFCAGIAHAQHTADELAKVTGEAVGVVTGNTLPMERAGHLQRFRSGSLRWLVNCDVLTTGFDAPNIDAIAILRATQSPGLFVQICGRGFRRAPGKTDCLVLDFGGNIERHGPVDAVDFGKAKKGSFGGGTAPEKVCPNCEEGCPASVLFCEGCGWKFPPRQLNHEETASAAAILSAPETFIVDEVQLTRHKKRNSDGPDTLRVDYLCGAQSISEWVCLEHEGFAKRKAALWWRARSLAPVPNINDAIDLWLRGALAMPSRLTARKEGKFWKILSVDLDPIPETWSEEVAGEVFEGIGEAVDLDTLPF